MPTYEDGYRKGVEDATHPLTDVENVAWHEHKGGGGTRASFNKVVLESRSKALLTKKVTKWVIVLNAPIRGEEYIGGHGRLWDSQSGAQRFLELSYGDTALGIFPIEVEISL